MRATDARWVGLLALCASLGCASTSAPRGFLPDPTLAQSDVHGSWVDVTFRGASGSERALGELIAITADSLWVLGTEGGRVVPTLSLIQGRLTAYDSESGAVGGASVLGFISTISNGALLLLTGPMWIIGGSAAAASQSRLPIHALEQEDPVSLGRFARFPQGMPEGISLDDLVPKAPMGPENEARRSRGRARPLAPP